VRFSALLLVAAVTGCGGNGDRPSEVVHRFLVAEDRAACQYLTAPQAKQCRRPGVPEPPAEAVVIQSVRVDGDRATIRASYDWTGYRRRTTFTLVRRDGDWLIVKRPTVIVGESPDTR
jgi:Putative lumazine-binding